MKKSRSAFLTVPDFYPHMDFGQIRRVSPWLRLASHWARRRTNLRLQVASRLAVALALIGAGLLAGVSIRADEAPRAALPDAQLDLRTVAGLEKVRGTWRYSDTRIKGITHRDVGPDLKATGRPNHTYDFEPDARAADFDDSKWEIIAPDSLEARRGHGRLSMNWYRLSITLPERAGGVDIRGSTAVFEIVVDDYAEVWVNGKLPYILGQGGETVAAGWNAPNRVVLSRGARPGDKYEIAVLGINGPLSTHPDTYIWVRSATLEFYRAGRPPLVPSVKLEVAELDPGLKTVLPPGAALEKVAGGFAFTEGPVWMPAGMGSLGPEAAEGFLLFSDPNNNIIYRAGSAGGVSVYMPKSGYTGEDVGEYHQPGSNGLAVDAQGRLTICQHGNRRVVRIEKNGLTTVLADRFEGKRLNSPNDLVYRRDGTLYFTDPPFGLPKLGADPRRELDFSGVFMVKDGAVKLAARDFSGPNGLAFSPDEKWLYVGNWDDHRKVVSKYPVKADGSLGSGVLFVDLTPAPGEDAIDGIKVDKLGDVYVSGPGGLWIFDAEGKKLGILRAPEHAHNLAWGGDDRQTLYLTAETSVYRLPLKVAGAGAWDGWRTAQR